MVLLHAGDILPTRIRPRLDNCSLMLFDLCTGNASVRGFYYEIFKSCLGVREKGDISELEIEAGNNNAVEGK